MQLLFEANGWIAIAGAEAAELSHSVRVSGISKAPCMPVGERERERVAGVLHDPPKYLLRKPKGLFF
jgi:hypothetical protein